MIKSIRIYIQIITLLFLNSTLFAQLNLNTVPTPAQLVQNTLVGNGITVSNVTYAGGSSSRAIFSNGNTTNLGLDNGVVLSTHPVGLIVNPASILISNNMGLAGDADLDAINNGCTTFDACVLEFDFVPMSDTVKFRYVFGSEEYPNFICSQYNDVFAFFVTGPNPTGGTYNNFNMARIPGTSLPVSVNSVNTGIPGNNYSASGCISLSYSNLYVDNLGLGGTSIGYNGLTVPLTAWCKVTPCQTYHIKIAVADGYNGLYDSGVFLEANSFVSNTFEVDTSYQNTTSNSATEGCSQGIFSFLLSAPASAPYTINYTIGGTATNGTDYAPIPTSITIPAGQDSASIIIDPIADGLTEGMETVVITYTNGCTPQTAIIQISDYTQMQLTLNNDTVICLGASLSLTAAVTGGASPLTYLWSSGASSTNTLNITPSTQTTYTVTVTDICNYTASEQVLVGVDSLTLSASATDELCGQTNGSVTVLASCSGNPTFEWSTNPVATTETVDNLAAGAYTVTVSCGACNLTATATIQNIPGPILNASSIINAHCGQTDGSAIVNATGGQSPYAYEWNSVPPQTTSQLQNAAPGNYIVTVSDAIGCESVLNVEINEYPGPMASFTANPAVTVINNLVTFLNFSTNATQYFWDFDDGNSSTDLNTSHTYLVPGEYQVWLYAQDIYNCIDSVSHEVVVNEELTFYVPGAFSPNSDGSNDVFGPKGLGVNNEYYQMYIFNRWGEQLFHTNDCNQMWDGYTTETGNLCPMGVYTWVIFLKTHGGTEHITRYTGTVTLMR